MILGITGGIGSGKSLVTDHLSEKYGFTAVKTDDLARTMMNSDEELKKKLKETFGPDIYGRDGKLNREVYTSVIHSKEENRLKSDRIVHPAVWAQVRKLISPGMNTTDRRNFAVETALPGSELRRICTEVWHVHSDPEVRIGRIMLSRGYTRDFSESVIRGQISEEEYKKIADVIITNDSTVDRLFAAVDRLVEERISQI